VLRRQIQALRELIAAADKGRFLPVDLLAVGVEQGLVRSLIQRRLPFETVVLGQLRVRLEKAAVDFQGGQSLVTLEGRVRPVQSEDAFADLELFGGLHRFEVDGRSGVLAAHIEIDRVAVQRLTAGTLESEVLEDLVENLGDRGLGALGEVLPPIEIPVRLDQAIEFAGFSEGGVSVRSRRLPLRFSVARVTPVADRLWLFLDMAAGRKAEPAAAAGRRP
jgi:hypothetical protein